MSSFDPGVAFIVGDDAASEPPLVFSLAIFAAAAVLLALMGAGAFG